MMIQYTIPLLGASRPHYSYYQLLTFENLQFVPDILDIPRIFGEAGDSV